MPTCLRKSDITWCGRRPDQGEFLFDNAAYAIKHYADDKTFTMCGECKVIAVAHGVLDKEPSMANRSGT